MVAMQARRIDEAPWSVWGSPNRLRARVGTAIGLLFLAGPVSDLARASLASWRATTIWACLGAFVTLYLALLPPMRAFACSGLRAISAGIAALAVLATAALLLGAPHSFVSLYVYVVAAAGMLLPPRAAIAVIATTAIGVGVGRSDTGTNASGTAAIVLTIVAIGLMTSGFGRQIRMNHDLRAAREELAGLAVAEERLRIARDLHDLLGHSLSVIALKSELAARLLERDGPRAARELADVQAVTRQALVEVREAVQGYRRLALADAVDGARTALAAAGIDCFVDDTTVALPGEVETVLAWAVREASTNVVRHSGARACAIRVHADATSAAVEISDDGTAAPSDGDGTGLAGLAERAAHLRGTLEAGTRPEGGFRLRLMVPLPAA
jgi:two-component system sensor histidine kinase DesK